MALPKGHIAALFFSLLILTPLLLIGLLQGWQRVLKYRWEERLEQQAVQTIRVPLADVVWQEEGREFTVHGRFFDAISHRTEGTYLIATGVFDEEETRLQTFLNTHAARSAETLSVIQLLFVIQCLAACVEWLFNSPFFPPRQKLFAPFSLSFGQLFQTPMVPPPRFFS